MRPWAEVVDVCATRQVRDVDLGQRPNEHELPLRAQIGDGGDKFHIQALIEHAEEAEAGVSEADLIDWLGLRHAPLAEVVDVDTAGEQMHRMVLPLLGLVETLSAREHQVCTFEQLPLADDQLGWRVSE